MVIVATLRSSVSQWLNILCNYRTQLQKLQQQLLGMQQVLLNRCYNYMCSFGFSPKFAALSRGKFKNI
jgi:hypothetical protein